jgi:putative ATP-dependent endonuclease of OLD family
VKSKEIRVVMTSIGELNSYYLNWGVLKMKILQLKIKNFRGISDTKLSFNDDMVLIGPNSCGKSTIIDALTLALSSAKYVRALSEHDFYGSNPIAEDRFTIIITLGDFQENDPNYNSNWFRSGRAVPKWWNLDSLSVSPQKTSDEDLLCAQIGFCARFDREELTVETIRFFCDDDEIEDPFIEDIVIPISNKIINDIGFFVLPAFRSRERSISYGADLLRRVITKLGGLPAEQIIMERDRLRNPQLPLEGEERLTSIVSSINDQISNIFPGKPKLKLRLTATDSESLLQNLVPHYEYSNGVPLPAGRHGTGLSSLQSLILLLEIGKSRINEGKNFILALEEPELHLPPGLQRRLLYSSQSIATQTICTSHSPRIAAFYRATDVKVLENLNGVLQGENLLRSPLNQTATNAERKLYLDNRAQVVEALMYERVLIPEGRIDFEWLRLLTENTEIAESHYDGANNTSLPFGSIVGIIPTHEASVITTFNKLSSVHTGLVILVDGDEAGNQYVRELLTGNITPKTIIQWPENWVFEDVICWILNANEQEVISRIQTTTNINAVTSIADLSVKLKTNNNGLKGNYLAYEDLVSVIRDIPECISRAKELLNVLSNVCYSSIANGNIEDDGRSTEASKVFRWVP